jgi:hypothetical protein
MSKKQEGINLSLKDSDQDSLREIARELGFFHGETPSLSKLVTAIAQRKIPLASPLSEATQRAIAHAAISNKADVATGIELARFLAIREEAVPVYREQMLRFLELFDFDLFDKINKTIKVKQPFQLFYQDAAQKDWSFTVKFAKLFLREQHTYLECWCEETEGNQDLAPLNHNWCFRMDRISQAGVIPVEGKWESLATLEVEFKLYGGLAHAYESCTEDSSSEWISSDPPTRKVKRQITSTFWFIREILRYGKDCKVLSPPELALRVGHQFAEATKLYE